MKILITGGTGFIGSALCYRLLADKHNLTVLSRQPETIQAPIQGISCLDDLPENISFDIVINLAGEPIADKRWSNTQKQEILDSRLKTTRQLIEFLKAIITKPKLFISGSAIGYYGINNINEADYNQEINEDASGDNSFSSQLCQQWEAIALQAETLGIRTCILRTGIVLGKGGGALSKMLLPFKLGLGGKIGHGKQWMPWIHIDDLIGIILHCIQHSEINGAINGTSPNPVTNQVFATTLGNVIKRPTMIPMPAIAIKLLMGQMGEELLLSGKKILPVKILNAGYQFTYENLDKALLAAI